MYTTIYIDSVFAVNMVMNMYILTLTTRSLRRTATRKRIIGVSALTAALYCAILCIPEISYEGKAGLFLLPTSILFVKLGCQTKGIRQLLRAMGFLFTYAILLGGFMLFARGQSTWIAKKEETIWGLLGVGYVGYALVDLGLKKWKEEQRQHFCRVNIPYEGHEVCVQALIDTGNSLVEPISQKPVTILEERVWEQLPMLKREEKFRMVPYNSIGKSQGMMEAYEVEQLTIEANDRRILCEKVMVGICKGQIASKGDYQMILHPKLLE